jgi:hypothetical protein
MTHALHFPAAMLLAGPASAVLDDARSVASASSARSPTAATVADFSIATTALPCSDTPRCNSAPSDASGETSFRIPSTDTPGFAAAAIAAYCLPCYRGVDSVDELLDLDRGSWERSLPDSSSLGGDCRPLRGAFIIDSASLTGFRNSVRGKLYQFCGTGDILIAINLRRRGDFWSLKVAQSFTVADRVIQPESRILRSTVNWNWSSGWRFGAHEE